MFKEKDSKKMDLDILDELIAKCENSMVSPFKKKKPEVKIEPEMDEETDEGEEQPEQESDFTDDEIQELIEALKAKKDQE